MFSINQAPKLTIIASYNKIKDWLELHALSLAIFFTVITIAGSVMPARNISSSGLADIPHLDKAVHFSMYFIIVFFWAMAWRTYNKNMVKAFIWALAIGLLMELTQFYFLSGRFFEIFDIIANISGSLLGLLLYYFYRKG